MAPFDLHGCSRLMVCCGGNHLTDEKYSSLTDSLALMRLLPSKLMLLLTHYTPAQYSATGTYDALGQERPLARGAECRHMVRGSQTSQG